ncbi:MAG: cobyrinate a,c-diamide synthase [candidate division WOR-3 bacterium]
MGDQVKGIPGVLISAPQGRSGKTIASLGLCGVLAAKGLRVQPFKKGPDYIDPSWLAAAAGRECRNLDLFFMREEVAKAAYGQACLGADVAVVEGAMGLYDGTGEGGEGSTAHLARLLGLPVILVVNTTRMTSSIAAMVSGYQQFEPNIEIAGVILNNVAGPRHEKKLVTAVERHCGIPVVGSIPRYADMNLEQRHLGHVPFAEREGGKITIARICAQLESRLDVKRILEIATRAQNQERISPGTQEHRAEGKAVIGVIRDKVFTFYYVENLEALEKAGAQLIFIDSLTDRLPEVDGPYIGGGFPEVFLHELEANRGLREDIALAIEKGLPVYAECAGLMYLSRAISWRNERREMVGAIPAEVELMERPQGHGYVELDVVQANPLFPRGISLRGHEFHHSRLITAEKLEFAYRLKRGHGVEQGKDGIVYKNVLAAYTHLHALGTPEWAQSFVSLSERARGGRRMMWAS